MLFPDQRAPHRLVGPSQRLGLGDRQRLNRAVRLYSQRDEALARMPGSSVRLQWTTRKGIHFGFWGRLGVVPMVAAPIAGFLLIMAIPGDYQNLADGLACAAMLEGLMLWIAFLRTRYPGRCFLYRDDRTATWTLDLSAESARLTEDSINGTMVVKEIARVDAGRFDLAERHFTLPATFDAVTGWSQDRSTCICLPNRVCPHDGQPLPPWLSPLAARGARRQSPAAFLGLWWPFNAETALPLARLMGDTPNAV